MITDIVPGNGTACPSNYSMLTSLYLGTDTICERWTGSFTMGACGGKNGRAGKTVYGFSDTFLNSFGGTRVCYQRSTTETYHTIVNKRLLTVNATTDTDPVVQPTCSVGEK